MIMTVRQLIYELLKCDLDKRVFLVDDVTFVDEQGETCNGSVYKIKKIEDLFYAREAYIHFDNYNHHAIREINNEE